MMKPAMTAPTTAMLPAMASGRPRSRFLVMLVALFGVADDVEEDAASDGGDDQKLEDKSGREFAGKEAVDERNGVADQCARGDDQRDIGEPFAHDAALHGRIGATLLADMEGDPGEERRADNQAGDRV